MREWVKNFFSKLTSVKTWCCLFFMAIAGYIVFTKQSEFKEIALVALVGLCSYMGINVAQDWVTKK